MKKKIKYIDHTMLECLKCGRIIISWYRHHYVTCFCGKCAIDGGFDYLRMAGEKGEFRLHKIRVPKYFLKEGK